MNSLLLEQGIECFAHIIALYALTAPARSQGHASIGFKVFTEISFDLVAHILGLRLTALVVFPRIEKPAVFATVHVRAAVGALIGSGHFTNHFDLASTVVTNHNYSG
jgi:hypothetical protein